VATSRRTRVLVPTLVVLGVLLALFTVFTSLWTDLLWFRSVGYSSVFTTQILTKTGLFLGFGLVMAAAIAANLVVAYRLRPPYRAMSPEQQSLDRYRMTLEPFRRLAVLVVAGGVGLLSGTSAAGEWRTWLTWVNRKSFGVTDPQFGIDVGYFAFSYPWWRFLLGFGFAVVILSLIAAAVTHYLYGGLRLQTPGEKATPAAQAHLSVLLGLFVLLKAVAYWLDRYGLAIKEDPLLTGLKYRDVNAVLPAKTILAVIALICAALFFANVFRRTWTLPGVGFGLLVLSAVLIGGVYPAIVQQFQVRPSEASKEAPYIERSINATRQAYALDDVQVQEYDARTIVDRQALAEDRSTIPTIRQLDPAVVSPTYRQFQQIRGFYGFPDSLDVDRYVVDGERRDTVIAVREVDLTGLPTGQRNWINEHLVYTHGYGVVAAFGNQRDAEGRPLFFEKNIPPEGELDLDQPRVYFGERSPAYSIVGAPEGANPRELDFPDDDSPTGQRNNTYEGEGGVPVGSLFNQLLYAMKFQEEKILLSDGLNSQSRILYIRNPRDRLEKVAPWLHIDGDPYPAVVDGRIQWILDGYTTVNGYPYSERTTLEESTSDSITATSRAVLAQPEEEVNYIRNSVKATVDAYDGTVSLYAWDESDPVLQVWQDAFPDTVQPRSEISDSLMQHLRYPEDLFKVQRDLYSRFHVDDPFAFYNGQDFWRIPDDPTKEASTDEQPPYYLTLQMPGQEEPAFSLTTTFAPQNRPTLAAFMAVNADPGEDYGTIRVLRLPSSTAIPGPGTVQANFSSDDEVANQLNILQRGGSAVQFGNLLTLPVGGGLLYVEPVYVRASGGESYPLLRKVLVSFGEQIAFEDTLQEALDVVFGGEAGIDTGEEPPAGEEPPPPGEPGAGANRALQQALADAQQALEDSQAALAAGDFAAYGVAQEALRDAITRAIQAQAQGGSNGEGSGGSPSPSPTETPSPSPSPNG